MIADPSNLGKFMIADSDGAPKAVQVSDRWHLWHNLGGAVEKTVIAHSSGWRTPPSPPELPQPPEPVRALDERTRARHAAVHELLDQGVGLLECARRLGWALNTIKRYARAVGTGFANDRQEFAARDIE